MSRPIETFLERWSPRALLALAVGIALLARAIALALAADVSPRANLWEYGEQAVCAIRHGSDLCLPYVTGIDQVYPSAYMPPLLSYYWLGLFHLVGEGTAARAIFLLIAGTAKREVLERAQAGADLPVRALIAQTRVPLRILWSPAHEV